MATFKPKPFEDRPGWYHIIGYSRYGANRKGEILNTVTGHITKGGMSDRYLRVSVYKDGDVKATLQYTHDLICIGFHGPRPTGYVVLHKDNNRWNTRPSNLKWGTQSENIKQTYEDGLRLPTTKKEFYFY